MKRITLFLAIIVGATVMLSSCGEKNVDPKPDPIPIPPPVVVLPPAPTGTVTGPTGSIPSGTSATIGWTLVISNTTTSTDTVRVYVNGNITPGIYTTANNTGNYITGNLTTTTTFSIKVVGKGGEFTLSIVVNVALDPRITFLTTGMFDFNNMICKALDSTSWNQGTPPSYNNYVFIWENFTGSPGNTCNANNSGNPITFKWYFVSQDGFWFHGVPYDQFVITGPNDFKLHRFGPILVWNSTHTGLIPVDGEYWEFFRRV